MKRHIRTAGFLVAALVCAAAMAQVAGVRRTSLEKVDVSVPNREAVVMRVEIDPGSGVARHTHPGDEISYVLEGEGELLIDGEAPRKLKAGDAFVVPMGKVHAARSTGTVPMKIVVNYVVEKGKPLATPAP
jgi:quercetin dioxygenase-like cupin family protein